MNLTKRNVDQIDPKKKDAIYFDDRLSGFGLRVSPAGRKTFIVQYRAGGRTRRYALGVFGAITCDEARLLAKETLGAVAKGQDPSHERNEMRKAPTVKQLAARFLEQHVSTRCKPRTVVEYRHALKAHIIPALGAFKVRDVKRSDMATLHHAMRNTPYQANRTLGVASKMFNLAEVWGLIDPGANPCRLISKYREKKRERFLNAEELRRLWTTLNEREAQGLESPHLAGAMRLLILTGCRLSEIQTLKWSYIVNGAMCLPDSKTGARHIPLSATAIDALRDIPAVSGNPYVVAGKSAGKYLTDFQRPWRRIRKAAYLEGVRIHDLRHTFASHALRNGISLPLLGKLLGHSQIQTTMRYAHLADDSVREAANIVGGALAETAVPIDQGRRKAISVAA
jgi:integrase